TPLSGEQPLASQQAPAPPEGTSSGMPPSPENFKVILSVSDPAGLQRTIKRLLEQAPMQSGERVEDGITFYTLAPPSTTVTGQEFNYFFLDGYLVVTSSREMARETVSLHRSGASLARSGQITGTQGQPTKASVVVYQNAAPFLAAMMKQMPPEIAGMLPQMLSDSAPKTN